MIRECVISAALLFWATNVLGAPCAGFIDVDDANPNQAGFCSSVEWVKNRSITQGCTATEYCPDNSVTRLQMAAFLSRMQAILPATVEDSSGKALGAFTLIQRGPFIEAGVFYRNGSDVHTLALDVDVDARTYSLRARSPVYFETTDCTGQAWISANDMWLPLTVGPRAGVLATSLAGEKVLYVSEPFPTSTTILRGSYLSTNDLGVCATQAIVSIQGWRVVETENLSAKFIPPFVIR